LQNLKEVVRLRESIHCDRPPSVSFVFWAFQWMDSVIGDRDSILPVPKGDRSVNVFNTTERNMAKILGIFPTPPTIQRQARVYDLKARLDWGEPALTIIDVRDRDQFNACRIMGAISMPANQVVQQALSNFELDRDLYIYGETDEETGAIAKHLRDAGFQNVSELRGGLPAWKAVNYPTEATALAQF
jgi:rhodanese-related sulfurtransferase